MRLPKLEFMRSKPRCRAASGLIAEPLRPSASVAGNESKARAGEAARRDKQPARARGGGSLGTIESPSGGSEVPLLQSRTPLPPPPTTPHVPWSRCDLDRSAQTSPRPQSTAQRATLPRRPTRPSTAGPPRRPTAQHPTAAQHGQAVAEAPQAEAPQAEAPQQAAFEASSRKRSGSTARLVWAVPSRRHPLTFLDEWAQQQQQQHGQQQQHRLGDAQGPPRAGNRQVCETPPPARLQPRLSSTHAR